MNDLHFSFADSVDDALIMVIHLPVMSQQEVDELLLQIVLSPQVNIDQHDT